MNQTTPANEPGRLEALKNYAIVDTLPEIGFDEIAELAAQICGCPAALVSYRVNRGNGSRQSMVFFQKSFPNARGKFRFAKPRSATTKSSTFLT
jgi:hypothetical protein